jgi:hypothetical protein
VAVTQAICTFGVCRDTTTNVNVNATFEFNAERAGLFPTDVALVDSCQEAGTRRATLPPTNAIAGSVDGAGNATVVLKHYQGGTVATTTTDGAGRYRFDGLAPGIYLLEATDGAVRSSGPQPFHIPAGSDREQFTLNLSLK